MDREMIGYLEALDVDGVWSLSAKKFPRMPMPKDHAGMVAAIHMARTACDGVKFGLRAYSHAWLTERGLPSQLPDQLKPKAQRLYPIVSPAVGIAVKSKFPVVKTEITKAMSDAVMDAASQGRLTDAPFVKERMAEARAYARKKLFG